MKTIKINKNSLTKKIGRVVKWTYKPMQGENLFIAYIGGEIPVLIASELTREEFEKIC